MDYPFHPKYVCAEEIKPGVFVVRTDFTCTGTFVVGHGTVEHVINNVSFYFYQEDGVASWTVAPDIEDTFIARVCAFDIRIWSMERRMPSDKNSLYYSFMSTFFTMLTAKYRAYKISTVL